MDYRVITKAMNLYSCQHLFFTTLDYEPLRPVFSKAPKAPNTLSQQNVLLLTGIASPQQLLEDMKSQVKSITPLTFADHHDFSPKDIQRLNETFTAMTAPKCIVTTEKDAARLTQVDGLSDEVIRNLYALPVRISFMLDQEEVFNNLITGYVIKNSRTHIVAQQKDDNKPKDEKAEADDKPKKIVFR